MATKKILESGNQDNSNIMSREPLRFWVPLLLHFANPKLPGTRQTLCLVFCCGPLTLRHAGDHIDSHAPGVYAYCVCVCVCVPVSVGLCVNVALMSFEAVPIPQSAVSRPSPASRARPRKVVALVCIRSCALQWFIKTLAWLEASTAAPSDKRKGHGIVLL